MFSTLRTTIKEQIEGAFFRNIALLMSGTLIAQVITAASMPVLSHLFLPAAFGVLGMLNSIVNLVSGISSLRYDMAIMIPERDEDAANLLAMCFSIILFMSLFTLLAVAFGGSHIAGWMDAPEFALWLWWAPLLIILTGSYQTLSYWCSRHKEFKRLSISAVFASGGSASAKMGGGFAGLATGGLVGGQIFGQALATFVLAFQVWRDDARKILDALDRHRFKPLAKKYRDFPLYNAPMTFLGNVSNGFPVLFFGIFFGPTVAGYYAIAYLVLKMPVQLLSSSLRRVYLQRASERYHQGESLSKDQWQVMLWLFGVGIIPVLLSIIFAPWGFEFFLGDEWLEAGIYSQVLIGYLFIRLISIPSTALIPVLNLQRAFLIWQIITVIVSAAGIGLGGYFDSPVLGVLYYSIAKGVMAFVLIIFVVKSARQQDHMPQQAYFE